MVEFGEKFTLQETMGSKDARKKWLNLPIVFNVSLLVSALCGTLSSCTEDVEDVENNQAKKEYIDEDDESKFVFNASAFNERRHKINTEDAVEMTLQLRNRLIQEPTGTRAIDDVANVYPLGFSKLITRASESSQMLDTMAYIVEFSNDGGFAIVASDNRMANPILALVEHGCYDDCMDNEGVDLFLEQAEEYILQNAELFEFGSFPFFD